MDKRKRKRTWCELFSQWYLGFANFIILLCGLGVVGLGIFSRCNPVTFGFGFRGIAISLFILGGLVFFIAFCGFCGLLLESHHITYSYAVILFLLIAGETAVIIYAFMQSSSTMPLSCEIWYHSLTNSTKQTFENTNHCCGFNSTDEKKLCDYNITCSELYSDSIAWTFSFNGYVLTGIVLFELTNLFLAAMVGHLYPKAPGFKNQINQAQAKAAQSSI